MASHPPRRVRTGCLKCRSRRRKCDEGKPQCQRCVAGGFDCQYGTRLSFLQKNAFTAQAGEAAGPSAAYPRVQFVPEPVTRPSQPDTAQAGCSPLPANLQIVHESPYTGPSSTPTTRTESGTSAAALGRPGPAESPVGSQQSSCLWPEEFRPAGGYEIALDALLSLGEDKTGTSTDRRHTPVSPLSPGIHLPSASPAVSGDYVASGPDGGIRNLAGAGARRLSDSRILELLRYYRYEVAPWLDIFDLGHTFGLTVLCLTSVSEPVLHSVIDFAASLAGPTREHERLYHANDSPTASSEGHSSRLLDTNSSTRLLCQALSESRTILTKELGDSSHSGTDKLAQLFGASPVLLDASPLTTALYYLMLRLDLSESLASGQASRLPLWHHHDLPLDRDISEPAERVFRSASDILVLCARASRLVFGGFAIPAESHVEQWTSLLESLGSWYTSRGQEFRPMVDIEGKGGGFPLLLFTSGAGMMANQLYHTAMLLMLQGRPRTAMVSAARVSSMSAQWHARRICGMALANDARESWDPCLVASFVVAARGMTHADQHGLLLGKLEEVGRLTGWKVAHYRSMLMDEWGI